MIPGVQVTIFSEGYRQTFQPFKLSPNSSLFITDISPDVTPDTTADGAAGIFGLYLMGETPTADQVHLSQSLALVSKPMALRGVLGKRTH